jgi:site-specific DNA-methyltransferase (adenine-specific)
VSEVGSPEPYWTDGQVTLYCGDFREVLPALGVTPDLVLADPPYGQTGLPWDRWPRDWPSALAPFARSMWCFGSLRMFMDHRDEFTDWKMSQDAVWEKNTGSAPARDRLRRVHDSAVHWYQGRWDGIYHECPRVPHDGPNWRSSRPARPGAALSGSRRERNSARRRSAKGSQGSSFRWTGVPEWLTSSP